MSDTENHESQLYGKKWTVCYAINGLSVCKDLQCLCGDRKIAKGSLRIGRRYPSPFDKDSIAINWFHAKCMFNQQRRSRIGTQIIGSLDDMDGVDNILLADRDLIEELIQGNIELIPDRPSGEEAMARSSSDKGLTVKAGSAVKKSVGKKSSGKSDASAGKRISINRRDAGRVLMM